VSQIFTYAGLALTVVCAAGAVVSAVREDRAHAARIARYEEVSSRG
jgi:hypothetical protein